MLPVADTSDPTQWSSADHHLCREGNYCDNSQSPVENECPEGTYMPRLGATASGDCVPCPGGYMCPRNSAGSPQTGAITPDACSTGKYCESGSLGDDGTCGGTDTCPTECTAGNYCPTKAPAEIPCQYGYYTGTTGQTICLECTAGTFCDNTGFSSPSSCTTGYVCPAGSAIEETCQ
jgi:hypothetical protein